MLTKIWHSCHLWGISLRSLWGPLCSSLSSHSLRWRPLSWNNDNTDSNDNRINHMPIMTEIKIMITIAAISIGMMIMIVMRRPLSWNKPGWVRRRHVWQFWTTSLFEKFQNDDNRGLSKHRILILFGCSQFSIAHPRLPCYVIVSEWSYDATAAVLEEDQRAEVEDKFHIW